MFENRDLQYVPHKKNKCSPQLLNLRTVFGNHKLQCMHFSSSFSNYAMLSRMSYRGADYETVGPLPLVERQPLLLLQGEHDDGQSEDQSFSRTGEGYANHISA